MLRLLLWTRGEAESVGRAFQTGDAAESGFVVCFGGTGPTGLAVWRQGTGSANILPSFHLQGLGEAPV